MPPVPVGAAHGAPDAEASLGEVDAVAADAADTVCLLPVDQVGADAALFDEVLHQPADFVVGKGGDDGGVHAKALMKAADDVVLAAALPGAEAAGRADPPLAGVQTQHDFPQAHSIKTAFFSRT